MPMVYTKSSTSIPKSVMLVFKIRIFSKIVRRPCRVPGACVSVRLNHVLSLESPECEWKGATLLFVGNIPTCNVLYFLQFSELFLTHQGTWTISLSISHNCRAPLPSAPPPFFYFEKNMFVKGKDGVECWCFFGRLRRKFSLPRDPGFPSFLARLPPSLLPSMPQPS